MIRCFYDSIFTSLKDWGFGGLGQEPFVKNGCKVQNCFLTNNRKFFPHYAKYDAILFHIRDLRDFPNQRLRRPEQVKLLILPFIHQSFIYKKLASNPNLKGINPTSNFGRSALYPNNTYGYLWMKSQTLTMKNQTAVPCEFPTISLV